MSDSAGTSSASSSPEGTPKLMHQVEAVTSAVRQVPGASLVKGVLDGALDAVGVVSPRARRVAAYAGVGLLGVVGVVEWPVAAAGAAIVWLTQSRPGNAARGTARTDARKPAAGPAERPKPEPETRTAKAAKTAKAVKKAAAKPKAAKPKAAKAPKSRTAAPATERRTTGRRSTASSSSGAGTRKS
ncbi:hypothetical protein [Kitasatospora sp. HPMI-4]|uniref:hypothetical protein n=1 Tax=Kitasatospora sp. HPMI-4 TaxID=3448443 RepID=UPI003F195EF7